MTLHAFSDFFVSWKGIATGILLVLGLVGADGRVTAAKLEAHLLDTADKFEMIDGLALNACLKDTDPRDPRDASLRKQMHCSTLEQKAGVIR